MPIETCWALPFEDCNEVFLKSLTHAYIQAYKGQDATKGMAKKSTRSVKKLCASATVYIIGGSHYRPRPLDD